MSDERFTVDEEGFVKSDVLGLARDAWSRRDFDQARMWYQKAAYGSAQLPPDEVDQLRTEVAEFATEDPFYNESLDMVRGLLESQPGFLQSALGKLVGDNRDAMYYVLYYAEVNGQLVRVKAGRSYKLYLPHQDVP